MSQLIDQRPATTSASSFFTPAADVEPSSAPSRPDAQPGPRPDARPTGRRSTRREHLVLFAAGVGLGLLALAAVLTWPGAPLSREALTRPTAIASAPTARTTPDAAQPTGPASTGATSGSNAGSNAGSTAGTNAGSTSGSTPATSTPTASGSVSDDPAVPAATVTIVSPTSLVAKSGVAVLISAKATYADGTPVPTQTVHWKVTRPSAHAIVYQGDGATHWLAPLQPGTYRLVVTVDGATGSAARTLVVQNGGFQQPTPKPTPQISGPADLTGPQKSPI